MIAGKVAAGKVIAGKAGERRIVEEEAKSCVNQAVEKVQKDFLALH
ncbi:hypothetical protein [Paenibacillus thiaminolyticus]|nr:hypothetical protein [Paenibacillus thiaminolyticus]WII39063.1 hypothetical protein O0V01_08205 [Paenibacillus thiaminolyticus]